MVQRIKSWLQERWETHPYFQGKTLPRFHPFPRELAQILQTELVGGPIWKIHEYSLKSKVNLSDRSQNCRKLQANRSPLRLSLPLCESILGFSQSKQRVL